MIRPRSKPTTIRDDLTTFYHDAQGSIHCYLTKILENRVLENRFIFYQLCTVSLHERKPIRPCHYLPCAIKVIETTCPLPNSKRFWTHAIYAGGYCISAAVHAPFNQEGRALAQRRKEETKTPGRQVTDYKTSKTLRGKELVYKTKAANAATMVLALKNLTEDPPV